MADFLFGPVPHSEAADYIASKPAVSRQVFDELLPELRSRAFVISGVEAADAVQAIRDRIAELPQGATWADVKKDTASKISVHLVNPDADADEQDRQLDASNRRAELLLRTHGFQAYQASAYKVLDRQRDVFPYWQYLTMHDGRVRPSHAALNGIVLPAGSPFWIHHYPPWDFGCRCQVVALSPEDKDDIEREDAGKPAEAQRVLTGPLQTELVQNNRLVRGPNNIVNVAPPPPDKYSWHPTDRGLTIADLKSRYDADVFAKFRTWAEKTEIERGKTVWSWIGGSQPPAPAPKPAPPAPVPAPTPKPSAAAAPQSGPATVAELLHRVGLDPARPAMPAQMQALRTALVKDAPVPAAQLLPSIQGAAGYNQITPARLTGLAQGFIDFLPPQVAAALPPISLRVEPTLKGALGDYSESLRRLRLNGAALDSDAVALQKTFWHELIHWAHDHGPQSFRDKIQALFARRTANFQGKPKPLKPWNHKTIRGYEDDFRDASGDTYAGRVYPWETGTPRGYEIATRHLEKLALAPEVLARHWNFQSPLTGNYAWREAFIECLALFFEPPSNP